MPVPKAAAPCSHGQQHPLPLSAVPPRTRPHRCHTGRKPQEPSAGASAPCPGSADFSLTKAAPHLNKSISIRTCQHRSVGGTGAAWTWGGDTWCPRCHCRDRVTLQVSQPRGAPQPFQGHPEFCQCLWGSERSRQRRGAAAAFPAAEDGLRSCSLETIRSSRNRKTIWPVSLLLTLEIWTVFVPGERQEDVEAHAESCSRVSCLAPAPQPRCSPGTGAALAVLSRAGASEGRLAWARAHRSPAASSPGPVTNRK